MNGNATTRTYLVYNDVANGATLDFSMGANPNTNWGIGAVDAPPSFNDGWTPPAIAQPGCQPGPEQAGQQQRGLRRGRSGSQGLRRQPDE